MAKDGVDRLVDKWLNDEGFRNAMLKDPEGTVRGAGIELTPEEWATLRNAVMASADEELRARISKSAVWN